MDDCDPVDQSTTGSFDGPGEYFDPFAEAYDAPPRERDPEDLVPWTGDDVEFYRDLARDAPGPALEVGVGTGRVYLDLLEAGVDVDGVDLSEPMLDRLREKADARDLNPNVWKDDVVAADFDREYGLVYAPARVLNWIWRLEDRIAALRAVREHLAPGGRFACNTFVPCCDTISENYGSEQAEEVVIDGEPHQVAVTTTFEDEMEQVARLRRVLRQGDETLAERETLFALIPKREFDLLFRLAGFSDWTVYGGFERDPLEDTSQEMVWVADA